MNKPKSKTGRPAVAGIVEITYRSSETGKAFLRETVLASVFEQLEDGARRLGFKTWQGAVRSVLRKKMLKAA